jgi:endonuclease-3
MKALNDQSARAHSIYNRLLNYYGIPKWRPPLSPLDEMVSTILSQNTNDTNRDRAYIALRQRFPTWEEVRDANLQEVIAAIRTAGLANQKGPRIQKILREITAERGSLSLAFLNDLPVDQARRWLQKFKGIGPKTAAIVLLFSLGKAAFPVDTHIHRLTRRIGLIPAKMNAEQAHEHLANLFPEDGYGPAHLNLIRLGREICHPRNPDCPHCPINDLCDYYQSG